MTCDGGGDNQESVRVICRDVQSNIQLLTNVVGMCRPSVQFAWLAPPWSWRLRSISASWIGDRYGFFGVIVYILCPRVKLLVSQTRCRTFDISPCDTPVNFDMSYWESPRPENRTIISTVTKRLMVGMICIFVWLICIQRQLTAECKHHKCDTMPLEHLGELALPLKQADWNWAKVMVNRKTPAMGGEGSLYIVSGLLITLA